MTHPSLDLLLTYNQIFNGVRKSVLSNIPQKTPQKGKAEFLSNIQLYAQNLSTGPEVGLPSGISKGHLIEIGLAQRPLLQSLCSEKSTGWDIEEIRKDIHLAIQTMSQIVTIYIWDQFHSGSIKISSRKKFQDMIRKTEAIKFYFEDYIIPNFLRSSFPHFQLMSQSLAEDYCLSPADIIKTKKLKKLEVISIYESVFSVKSSSQRERRDLKADPIFQFYKKKKLTTAELNAKYKTLKVAQIFSEYHKRFCEDSTGALLDKIPYKNLEHTMTDVVRFFNKKNLIEIEETKRIQMRRAIQTRAMYLFLIRSHLTQVRQLAPSVSQKPYEELVCVMNAYLEKLEKFLRAVCHEVRMNDLRGLAAMDATYQKKILPGLVFFYNIQIQKKKPHKTASMQDVFSDVTKTLGDESASEQIYSDHIRSLKNLLKNKKIKGNGKYIQSTFKETIFKINFLENSFPTFLT
jgi:hypothetical protein